MAISFTGVVVSDLIEGSGQGAQNIFCIENNIQSRVKIYIKRLYTQMDALATVSAVKPVIRAYRATNIVPYSNSTSYTKGFFDSSQTSDSGVRIWSGATPSYSGKSGLSGTLGDAQWSWFGMRMVDLSGQIQPQDQFLLPSYAQNSNIYYTLYPGESLMCRVVPTAVTSDPMTTHYFINVVWQEEPISVHSISGTVTASGTGVVGAEVVVLIADDVNLTNAYLWSIVTTGTGGSWSCSNIPDGKIAYAYAQNYIGGTYYTATGAPFIS